MIVRILVIALLSMSLSCAGDSSDSEGPVRLAANQMKSLVRPGPLAKAHAGLDHPEDCGACHHPTRGLTDQLCLDCHTDLAKRMSARIGPHSAYSGRCYECHTEHRGLAHNQLQDNVSTTTLRALN